jgi:hypothetical protein
MDEGQEEKDPQWEYYVEYIEAWTKSAEEFVRQFFPTDEHIPSRAVQSIVPRLNKLGEQGWELVHMQPVVVGKEGEIIFWGDQYRFVVDSSVYLCAFKRIKRTV